jgi:hypothetical protein
VHEGNEMFIKMVFSKCLANETLADTIKSFGQIQFKEESFLIPGFKMKRVNNFVSNDNVSGDANHMKLLSLRITSLLYVLQLHIHLLFCLSHHMIVMLGN